MFKDLVLAILDYLDEDDILVLSTTNKEFHCYLEPLKNIQFLVKKDLNKELFFQKYMDNLPDFIKRGFRLKKLSVEVKQQNLLANLPRCSNLEASAFYGYGSNYGRTKFSGLNKELFALLNIKTSVEFPRYFKGDDQTWILENMRGKMTSLSVEWMDEKDVTLLREILVDGRLKQLNLGVVSFEHWKGISDGLVKSNLIRFRFDLRWAREDELYILANAIKNSTIRYLAMVAEFLFDEHLTPLIEILPDSKLQEIDGLELTTDSICELFAKNLVKSDLRKVSLSICIQHLERILVAISQSKLESLCIRSACSLAILSKCVNNLPVAKLEIECSYASNGAVVNFIESIKKSSMRELQMRNWSIESEDMIRIGKHLSRTNLQSLSLGRLDLNDTAMLKQFAHCVCRHS
ncbi:hypothetical protein HDV01_002091 [Terramyces sp. JEL0728]|nr:hypothetical protein HDV01_002091 [Terramyces sp. JEL0728]